MTHLGTKTIETNRLILRCFISEDAQAMYENWSSDPEVTKFLTWPTHSSVEVSQWVLSDWISHYLEPDFYQWAIVPKDLGAPIGSISVVSKSERLQKVEIGYCIGRSWWHRGYMSEALAAVIEFFFDEVGMNRVEACYDPNNPHSGAVMRKCGMTYEGTHRQSGWNNQGLCDASWYSILKTER